MGHHEQNQSIRDRRAAPQFRPSYYVSVAATWVTGSRLVMAFLSCELIEDRATEYIALGLAMLSYFSSMAGIRERSHPTSTMRSISGSWLNMTSKMSSKSVHETFAKDLNDPEFVALYLEECLNDSTDLFFKALGDVARANGMTEMASKTGRTREALYRSLSEAGNPEFRTVHSALDALGLQLLVAVKERVA